MAETAYVPRLRTEYEGTIRKALQEQFSYKNVMQLPKLEKIVLNMGVGKATQKAALLDVIDFCISRVI